MLLNTKSPDFIDLTIKASKENISTKDNNILMIH